MKITLSAMNGSTALVLPKIIFMAMKKNAPTLKEKITTNYNLQLQLFKYYQLQKLMLKSLFS